MKINKATLTSQVKEAFQEVFPGLKLEFFKEKHSENEMSRKEDMISNDVSLISLNSNLKDGDLLFDEEWTAIEFENEVKKAFDINVQVFRKSNNIYLQTSKTDHWTLSEQNRKGVRSQQ